MVASSGGWQQFIFFIQNKRIYVDPHHTLYKWMSQIHHCPNCFRNKSVIEVKYNYYKKQLVLNVCEFAQQHSSTTVCFMLAENCSAWLFQESFCYSTIWWYHETYFQKCISSDYITGLRLGCHRPEKKRKIIEKLIDGVKNISDLSSESPILDDREEMCSYWKGMEKDS